MTYCTICIYIIYNIEIFGQVLLLYCDFVSRMATPFQNIPWLWMPSKVLWGYVGLLDKMMLSVGD